MKLSGRTILITGGTAGIGHELIKLLAPRNAKVICIGRNEQALAEVTERYPNVVPKKCDLSASEELESTLAEVVLAHPELSVIINNAGVQFTEWLNDEKFRYASIEREIAINLAAPIKICALVLPALLATGAPAAIINVTSGLALYPKTSSAVYCATKAGLRSFSKSLRYQLENTPVQVYEAVMPLVATAMTEGRGGAKLPAERAAKALVHGVERGREEIYIGKSRLIPIVARLSPGLMAKILKNA